MTQSQLYPFSSPITFAYQGSDSAYDALQEIARNYNHKRPGSVELQRATDAGPKSWTAVDCLISDQLGELVDSGRAAASPVRCLALAASHSAPDVLSLDSSPWLLPLSEFADCYFSQLVEYVAMQREQRWVHQLVDVSLTHDFRGALGVIGLASQVLRATPTNAGIVKKLDAASLKLEALLQDAQTLTIPGLFRDRANHDTPEPQEVCALDSVLARVEAWHEATHRGRILDVAPTLRNASQLPVAAEVVLRGLVDCLCRLSSRETPVELTPCSSGGVLLQAAGLRLSAEQVAALQAQGGAMRGGHELRQLPFRLGLSVAAAAAHDGQVMARLTLDSPQQSATHTLQLSYRWA